MKKIMLFILVVAVISGCAKESVKTGDIAGKMLPPYTFDNSYIGEPKVGNEIIVSLVIKGNIARLSYGNTTFGSSEIGHDGSSHEVTDLFEIYESRIEMEKGVSEMTVTIPVKILREGHGTVGMGWTDGSTRFGTGVEIQTEEYVAPEDPLPEYCKDLPAGVGCVREVPMSEIG